MSAAFANAPDATERVLSTLNADGTRRWLSPRVSPGRFLRARRITAIALILIFTVIPYIRLNEKPLVLLDIAARRFTLFGITFLPTDTVLLSLFMVAIFIAVFLATALFGRVWCGWACPQTVYMEFLYRPIERLFEGMPGRAKRGIQGTGPARILKYTSFFIVSCYLAHTFLSYFVGVDKLAIWAQQSPLEHPTPFLVMCAVTALMMFDFCYFREQVCTIACPYGRLQSVMLDRHSLIVGYDRTRGEPRGARKQQMAATNRPVLALPILEMARNAQSCAAPTSAGEMEQTDGGRERRSEVCVSGAPQASRVGDCVDCGLCVVTCPTGIDIREGLQMECIGCAQCIDACDAVMTKLRRPPGLIRYSSQAIMAGEKRRVWRARVVVYPVLLTFVLAVFAIVLATQAPFHANILRGPGRPFDVRENGLIANTLRVKLINRLDTPGTYRFELLEPAAAMIEMEASPLELAPGESLTAPIIFLVPAEVFSHGRATGRVRITAGESSVERTCALVGPVVGVRGGGT